MSSRCGSLPVHARGLHDPQRLPQDSVIVNNTAIDFFAKHLFINNTYRDNDVTGGSIYAEWLTVSTVFISNVAASLKAKWGSTANTIIGNVAASIELSNGAIGNTAIGNVVTAAIKFAQGSFFNTAVSKCGRRCDTHIK